MAEQARSRVVGLAWRCTPLLTALLLAACAVGPGGSPVGGSSGWRQVMAPAALAGVSLLDVAGFGSGLAAVGNSPDVGGLHYGGAFTSSDGSTWNAASTEPFKGYTANVVGRHGAGLVALGSACAVECGGFYSWSSTDGITWSEPGTTTTPNASRATGIVERGSTIVAVASELLDPSTNHVRGLVFLSSDGTTWTDAPNLDMFDNAGIAGIASDGSGMVMVGNKLLENGDRNGAAWTSTDGKTWVPASDDGSFEGALVQAVAHGTGGYLAVGAIGVDGAVWTSSDGASWTRTDGGAFKASALADVATSGSGYVAIGRGAGGGMAWTSKDGKSWQGAGALAGADAATFTGVAVGSTASIIVGRPLGSTPAGLVWIGPLP